MDQTLDVGTFFDRVTARWPKRTALVTEQGDRYQYGELQAEVQAVARGLREHGVEQGDRLALFSPNTPEFVSTYFATITLGAVVVPISYRASPQDVEYLVEASGAGTIVYDSSTAETVDRFVDSLDADAVQVGSGEFESLRQPNGATIAPQASRSDRAYIAHSSGSTGQPKLIPHTHDDALLGGLQGVQEVGLSRDDRGLSLAPLFHTAGMYTFFVPHLFTGATAILQKEFDPVATLELIERESATAIFAVPAQYRAMLRATEQADYDTSSLEYIRTGASPMSERDISRAQAEFAEQFYNTYGLTECQQNVTIFTPDDPPEKKASIGKASYFWETKVLEPADPGDADLGAEVEPPDTGMLMIQGPMLTEGYLNRPEKNETVFIDGWIYTGDVVEIDEEGYIFIVDRMDNMIVSGGENVYPQEVESVLVDHPAVVDCGVFGVPDEEWGQRVTAAVVVDADVSEADLDEYMRASEALANYKRPREYRFVEEIPRSPGSGSIQRGELPSL